MLDTITTFIEQSGAWMYVLAPLFMVVVAILPIPAEIPAFMNGMIFGAVIGTVITWSGAMVGAIISFELARAFGRPLAAQVLPARAMESLDHIALSAGWPGLLAFRLVPTIAFTLINWAAGLTTVRRWTYCWTAAVGMIPGAIVFTLSGTGMRALYTRSPAVGVAVAVAVLAAIAYAARRIKLPPTHTTQGPTT